MEGTLTVVLYRFSELFRDLKLKPVAFLIYKINNFLTGASIGYNARLGPGLNFTHSNGIVINGMVVSGRNLIMDHQVTIGMANQGVPRIGSYVFMGAGSKILGNVNIGDYSRVGANAVIVKDVPECSTVVGIPGKVVKTEPERKHKQRYQYPYKKITMKHL